jgi:hypothetical protein
MTDRATLTALADRLKGASMGLRCRADLCEAEEMSVEEATALSTLLADAAATLRSLAAAPEGQRKPPDCGNCGQPWSAFHECPIAGEAYPVQAVQAPAPQESSPAPAALDREARPQSPDLVTARGQLATAHALLRLTPTDDREKSVERAIAVDAAVADLERAVAAAVGDREARLREALEAAQTAMAHLEVCAGCGEDSWNECDGGRQAKQAQSLIDAALAEPRP